MAGLDLVLLAGLILLLLPVIILPWEGRKVPDPLYVFIALAGVAASVARDGTGAGLASAAAGALCLVATAAAISALRENLRVQLVTGSHIKLLAAGATWLGLGGTIIMLLLAFAALFVIGAIENRKSITRRPDFSTVAAITIAGLNIQQSLFVIS